VSEFNIIPVSKSDYHVVNRKYSFPPSLEIMFPAENMVLPQLWIRTQRGFPLAGADSAEAVDGREEMDMNALLHCAAAHCDRDTILKILRWGADIMAEDVEQHIVLEIAIANKNSKFPLIATCYIFLYKKYYHFTKCCCETVLYIHVNHLFLILQ
jgi:hypothetical protein